jgi:Zn finger protein HypA/HybF involved in hydrogenase expression
MHEHGIADHILQAILSHPECPRGGIPVAVTVKVSEFSGLSGEALQASLNHVCEHEGRPPIALTVESVPLLGECRQCAQVSEVSEELTCALCGASPVRLCGGEVVVIEACQYA